jgi:hypothetical protein
MSVHGTLTAYHAGKCRCDPCRRASARHSKEWRLDKHRGIERLVDAEPARVHVRLLLDRGMSYRAIALTAGWSSRNSLDGALAAQRIRPGTLKRILAVNVHSDVRLDRYTDATGSSRRLRALAVGGWPTRDLARCLGARDPSTVQDIAAGRCSTIRLRTAVAIEELYDELWDRPGPSPRTAAIAARKGWLPALAWDDDVIDDPDHLPPDPRRTKASAPAIEDIAELAAQGYATNAQIGWRLGLTPAAVSAIRRRAT